VPEHVEHAAIAAEYAHVTAPLRRLVDRYAGEIAVALCADREVPDWVRATIKELPKVMEESDRKAHQFERAVLDLVEAGMLRRDVGQTFNGIITDVDDDKPSRGSVMLCDPAVEARVESSSGSLPLGHDVEVKLAAADVSKRLVRFQLA
jgi:exoribonuclease R